MFRVFKNIMAKHLRAMLSHSSHFIFICNLSMRQKSIFSFVFCFLLDFLKPYEIPQGTEFPLFNHIKISTFIYKFINKQNINKNSKYFRNYFLQKFIVDLISTLYFYVYILQSANILVHSKGFVKTFENYG